MFDNCHNSEKDAGCGSPPSLELPTKKATSGDCAEGACGCSGGVPVFDGMDPRYKVALWTVIGINGAMFLTEMTAGRIAGSHALQADALDFLGDTITYGLSLAVIGASLRTRATAALLKGLSLSAMALWVFGSTAYHTLILGVPRAEVMGIIGFMALVANLTSVALLMRYKGRGRERSIGMAMFSQRRH